MNLPALPPATVPTRQLLSALKRPFNQPTTRNPSRTPTHAPRSALTRYFGERDWWNEMSKRCMQVGGSGPGPSGGSHWDAAASPVSEGISPALPCYCQAQAGAGGLCAEGSDSAARQVEACTAPCPPLAAQLRRLTGPGTAPHWTTLSCTTMRYVPEPLRGAAGWPAWCACVHLSHAARQNDNCPKPQGQAAFLAASWLACQSPWRRAGTAPSHASPLTIGALLPARAPLPCLQLKKL